MDRDSLVTGQAYAAGMAIMQGIEMGHRVDLVFLLRTHDVPGEIDEAILQAHGAGLRAAVAVLDLPSITNAAWPMGVPFYMAPPAGEDERKQLAMMARAVLPHGSVINWTRSPTGSTKKSPMGFAVE